MGVMSVSTCPEEATPGVGGFAVYDLRGSGSSSSAILEFSFSPPVVGSTAGGGSDASSGPVITCCKFNHNSQVRDKREGISVAKRQNPFPLHLVKLRNRAFKFLVHSSLVCLAKYPKPHEK